MENYKKLLKEYTDKVIDNYEDWFAQDILVDISENGGFDSLIDENYEFLFNVDLSRDLNNIIENLLDDEYNEKDQKKKDEYYKLVIEFIKLKRITDKRILESKAYDEDYVNQYIFSIYKTEKNNIKQLEVNKLPTIPIELNQNLKDSDFIIKKLYSFLINEQFIEKSTIKDFSAHFNKKRQGVQKIHWKEENQKLIELILFLNEKEILRPVRKEINRPFVPIIINHFIDKKGNEFKSGSISSALNKKSQEKFSGFTKSFERFFNELKIEFN